MNRIGVAIVGVNGAVASTVIAGVELMKRGFAPRVGMITEKTDARIAESITELLDLAPLESLVFAGWDLQFSNAFEGALHHKVLPAHVLEQVRTELERVKPWPAVFAKSYVGKLSGENVVRAGASARRSPSSKREPREASKRPTGSTASSWSTSRRPSGSSTSSRSTKTSAPSRRGSTRTTRAITPAMRYFYTANRLRIPYCNFTPSLTNVPALAQQAVETGNPFGGMDGKTGQTLVKTALASMFRARRLLIEGWYSANVLGNSDGLVLDDPSSNKTKVLSKANVLDSIVGYKVENHQVHIHYYKPRGDSKEAWDNIDIVGFAGVPMQMKINFLCQDSVLAAPLVIDLVRLLDVAKRVGERGIQRQLSMFFWGRHTTRRTRRPCTTCFSSRRSSTDWRVGHATLAAAGAARTASKRTPSAPRRGSTPRRRRGPARPGSPGRPATPCPRPLRRGRLFMKLRVTPTGAWPIVGDEEQASAHTGARSAASSSGQVAPESRAVKKQFAAFVGAKHCLLTHCGTSALLHRAHGLPGVRAGDEVMVPAYSFVATPLAVLHIGAVPVFADVDAATEVSRPRRARVGRHGPHPRRHARPHARVRRRLARARGGRPSPRSGPRGRRGAGARGPHRQGHPVGAIGAARRRFLAPVEQGTCRGGRGRPLRHLRRRIAREAGAVRNFGQDVSRAGDEAEYDLTRPLDGTRSLDSRRIGSMYRGNEMTAAFARAQLWKLPERTERCQQQRRAPRSRALAELPGVTAATHVPEGTHLRVHHKYRVHLDPARWQGPLDPTSSSYGTSLCAHCKPKGSRSSSGSPCHSLPRAQGDFRRRDRSGGAFPQCACRGRDRPCRQLRPRALPADPGAPRRLPPALLAVVPAHRADRRRRRSVHRGLPARLASPRSACGMGDPPHVVTTRLRPRPPHASRSSSAGRAAGRTLLAVVGLLLIAYLVRGAGPARVADTLWAARVWLPLIVALELVQLASDVVTLRVQLGAYAHDVAAATWVRSSALAYSMMICLPAGRAAGEVARAPLLIAKTSAHRGRRRRQHPTPVSVRLRHRGAFSRSAFAVVADHLGWNSPGPLAPARRQTHSSW